MDATFDVNSVRSRFPAVLREAVGGRPAVFADGPGGTQVPATVAAAMSDYLLGFNANTGGEFELSVRTDQLIDDARRHGGAFVGGSADAISFGANMTSLNFNLARAVGRMMRPGDEIVVTTLDHDANVSPWLLLAQDRDLVVRTVGLTAELTLDLADLQSKLTDRTRVVAFTLASNAVGTLTPAAQISALAHQVGALSWVDAVAYAPHRRIDVESLGCDVLLCSPYKFFGPHLGMAWLRPDLAESLPAERVRPAEEKPAGHRFETGTLSHEALAGFVAAVEYLASLGSGTDLGSRLDSAYAAIESHETDLVRRFLAGIGAVGGVRPAGVAVADPDRRECTFGLVVDGGGTARIARALGDRGIYTWNGNFYAQGVVEHLGLDLADGLLRIGFVHYNTADEVDRIIAELAVALGQEARSQ